MYRIITLREPRSLDPLVIINLFQNAVLYNQGDEALLLVQWQRWPSESVRPWWAHTSSSPPRPASRPCKGTNSLSASKKSVYSCQESVKAVFQ